MLPYSCCLNSDLFRKAAQILGKACQFHHLMDFLSLLNKTRAFVFQVKC